MKNNKLRILSLALLAFLAQGSCTYAASSDKSDYTKDELNNLTPGWDAKDIDKSNYKVDSYKNSFSSTQTPDAKDKDTSDTTSKDNTSSTTTAVDTSVANAIVSSSPSTGNRGDFWGKTSDGKWILIEQGVPVSGWKMVRGQWYYMDSNGVMQTGWINDGNNWYYLNSDGSMAYNTYVGGYYLDWNGVMQ